MQVAEALVSVRRAGSQEYGELRVAAEWLPSGPQGPKEG
jgi:hypothetical protein